MSRIHGKNGRVALAPSDSDDPVVVVNLSSWSLNMTADDQDVTCFGDANKNYVRGFSDASVQFQGFYDTEDTTVIDAAASGDAVLGYLYPNETTGEYWWGSWLLDITVQAAVNSAVSISSNGKAAGTITHVTPS